MARYLILDTDGATATLLAVQTGRGGIRIEAAQTWTIELSLSVANAEALGRSVKEKLAGWKMSPASLVVAVGRDRVILKDVKYPNVPAHDEPAIVRFQALKELTDGGEDQVLDYCPQAASGGQKKALVVAAKREVVRMAQLFAQGAGLKLHAIVPRPFGLAALAQTATPPPASDATIGVLALTTNGGEFITSRGTEVLFARPVSGPAVASDTALIGEIRRNLAVHASQAGHDPVKALYVAEGLAGPAIVERIRDTLAIPVHQLSPLAGTNITSGAPPGQMASAVGIGRLLASAELPINFAKPREPKPPVDPHRRPLLMGFAVALALLLGVGLLAWLQLSAKDRELARLRTELNGRVAELVALEPDAKRHDEVKKWVDNEVVWLDELYDLTARVPDISKLRVTHMVGDPIAVAANADPRKRQYVSRVTLKGLATDDAKPQQLNSELVKDGHYHVEPKYVGPNVSGTDRRSFALQFSQRYDIERRTPSSYNRIFAAEIPERRGRNRGGAGFDLSTLLFGGGAP